MLFWAAHRFLLVFIDSFLHFNVCIIPDGNGFKTSTMRLGADAIVFSRAIRAGYSLFLWMWIHVHWNAYNFLFYTLFNQESDTKCWLVVVHLFKANWAGWCDCPNGEHFYYNSNESIALYCMLPFVSISIMTIMFCLSYRWTLKCPVMMLNQLSTAPNIFGIATCKPFWNGLLFKPRMSLCCR